MTSTIEELQLALQETVELITDGLERINTRKNAGSKTEISGSPSAWTSTTSLLEQCAAISEEYDSQDKPVIRLVHHFACSGGSIFCRCLAAMPNVYLLSEAHPYSKLHTSDEQVRYLPTDIVTLAKYAGVPRHRELARKIFAESIESTSNHLSDLGGTLVIRDHSHADFCLAHEPPIGGAIVDALKNHFQLASLLTIRDPIDSYLSLQERQWQHFKPATFDEYCRRYLLFTESYQDAETIRYEDFIAEPESVVARACNILDLPYDANFIDLMELFPMTGESGRFSAEQVSPRPRKPLCDELVKEIGLSENYAIFAAKFDYEHDGTKIEWRNSTPS